MAPKLLASIVLIITSLNSFAQSNLPGDIQDFYESKNFINAFSTRSERTELVKFTDHTKLPLEYQNPRLKQVYRLLTQLEGRIRRVEFNIPGTVESPYYLTSPGLLKIVDWNRNGSVIHVRLYHYKLDTYANFKLIAAYENSYHSFDPEQTLSELADNIERQNTEIHHWRLTKNGWMKEELNGIY